MDGKITNGAVYENETEIDHNGRNVILTEMKNGKKWVVSDGSLKGKILNTKTGEYEENLEMKENQEKLKVNQLITSIKASVEAGDSRDYIEGYVKELPDDSVTAEQIKNLNNTLNPKGYNVVDKTPGYALEDYDVNGKKTEQIIASIK